LDTISAGALVAFTMECFESGILTEADTDGKAYRFGDADAMLRLVEQIGLREGFGNLLADGVRIAAQKIGRGAEKAAIHSKGQEAAMHDPRGKTFLALSYSLSPTGADHIEAQHEPPFQMKSPLLDQLAPLGILEPLNPFSMGPEKVRAFTIMQKVWSLYNSIGICNFVAAPMFALSFPQMVDSVRAITGWDTSLWELLRVGERANVMARMFNIRQGIGSDQDTLPHRFFEPTPVGPIKGKRIDPEEFKKMVSLYYEMAGWDKEGRPTPGKLVDLGLEWVM